MVCAEDKHLMMTAPDQGSQTHSPQISGTRDWGPPCHGTTLTGQSDIRQKEIRDLDYPCVLMPLDSATFGIDLIPSK